jgi:hypothetical protein
MAKVPGVDEHQAQPTKNDRPAIQDLVIGDLARWGPAGLVAQVVADIEARKQVGLERYGTLLQAFNGRDALLDAYQEVLDLCQYLRQMKEEQRPRTFAVLVIYTKALRMALQLRDMIEDRTHEAAGSVTSLGDPARGD